MKNQMCINKDIKIYIDCKEDKMVHIVIRNQKSEKSVSELAKMMYQEVRNIICKQELVIFHERVFASNTCYEEIKKVRSSILELESDNDCFSFLDGSPQWGQGISGINICAVKKSAGTMKDVIVNEKIRGHIWETPAADYFMLHSARGKASDGYFDQTYQMFGESIEVLEKYGFCLKQVIRTWIYLDKILTQYDEFNKARTKVFLEQHLWDEASQDEAEDIYMPASTGIGCGNPYGCAGAMDVLAIKVKDGEKLAIQCETGDKQRSAYRYGSAFSRAMVVKDEDEEFVYLSGTASIDETGATVYLDDIKAQIEKTYQVIEAILKKYNMNMEALCEGTVFIKKPEFIEEYNQFIEKMKYDLPVNVTVTDVCRDNLLFEMDATFRKKRTKA